MKALLVPIILGNLFLFNQEVATSQDQTDPVAEIEKELNITKMKRTRSDIFSIATAVESYAVDHNKYPWIETIQELGNYLEPIYIRAVPQNDAWGTEFKFVAEERSGTYRIISAGADRQFDSSSWWKKDPYTDLNDDVVFENGSFIRDWKPPEPQVVPGAAAAALRARLDQYVQNMPSQDITLEKRELGFFAMDLSKIRDPDEMKALQQYVDSIEAKSPRSPRASMAQAFFSLMVNDFKEASAALKRAETLFPAYAQLGMAENILFAQRRYTMADLRAIATAVEAFHIDYNTYPLETEGNIENIRGQVEPTYIRKLPSLDAWGNPLVYRCMESKGPYWIISYGADGKPDSGIYDESGVPGRSAAKPTSEDEADIIFSDGTLIRYPEER